MNRRPILNVIAVVILLALVYLHFRSWGTLEWQAFFAQTSQARVIHLAFAVFLIYVSYIVLVVRWKILLQPLRQSSVARLFPPTAIGFTGLVLLGRAGEVIRPYLIARSEDVSVPSQMVLLLAERLLDVLACVLLVAISLLADHTWVSGSYLGKLGSVVVIVGATGLAISACAFILRWKAGSFARWLKPVCSRIGGSFACRAATEVGTIGRELFALTSVLKVTSLSLLLWILNGLACWEVIRAYPAPLDHLGLGRAFLIMGFGILGSVIQLPAIGGGAQLVTIAALVHVFGVPRELAVSCGISIWLVTFASIVPVGLSLAHRGGLSLRKLSREPIETTS